MCCLIKYIFLSNELILLKYLICLLFYKIKFKEKFIGVKIGKFSLILLVLFLFKKCSVIYVIIIV